MKTLVNMNHMSHVNSFIFQAAFSSIIVALAFLVDDVLDMVLNDLVVGPSKKYIKAAIHCVFIFILTFGVIFLFRFLFGWGDTFLGCPCATNTKK